MNSTCRAKQTAHAVRCSGSSLPSATQIGMRLPEWLATCLCVLALAFHSARPVMAGIADTPLPSFSDGKPSVQVMAVPGVVKRGQLQTEFFCTALDSVPVDIGVEIFDASGALLNDVSTGAGALLNVGPGQTVTVGTSATATYLETAVIPLATKLQGSARVVASSNGVRCNVVIVDDAVTPPASLATLGESVQPAPGPLPAALPLPQFADGQPATHSAIIPGVVKRGNVETDFICASLAPTNIHLGIEVFDPAGNPANAIASGNGAVLNVAPGATVTFGTTGTAAFFETTVITMAGVAQGAARVVSTSDQVVCTALVLDAAVTPPTSMSAFGAATAASTATMPSPLPSFADGKPSVPILTVPGVVKRGRLQTDILCTSLESLPVDIGVEIFDANGALLNNVTAGVGAMLSVSTAHTVTIGTSGTATYLESAVIPLTNVSQGSARVVASAPGVRCNVVIVDDAVSPPVSLATLGEGVQPAPGAVPPTLPLPQFADGQQATHAAVVPGVVKRGSVEMAFFCTSLASGPIDIAVEIFAPDGTLVNSVAGGNGAVLNVPPRATVTVGTTGTASLLESTVIVSPSVAQGLARIVSTSGQLTCTALVLDAAVTPPAAMSALMGWPGSGTAATMPTFTPTATPTVTPTVTPTPTPLSEDYFKLYKANIAAGAPAFVSPADPTLLDQFESKVTRVVKPALFGNPVNAGGGFINSAIHLECYAIKDAKIDPRQPKFRGRRVQVENRFGLQTLDVTTPRQLCVPSLADRLAPPPPVLPPHNVDHFKCYKAKVAKGFAKFGGAEVTLEDEFESKRTSVGKPAEVCNPVDAEGSGLKDPAVHLACYKIKDAATGPAQPVFLATNIFTQNHFGAEQLTASKASLLCVPSLQTDLGPIP